VRFGDLFEEVFRNANNPRITAFGTSNPSMDFMPVKSLTRATRSIISRYPQKSMDYLFPPGDLKLREQIAQQYAQTYTRVSANEIIITSGATEGRVADLFCGAAHDRANGDAGSRDRY
jgi:DNA-binding transcriptional MocR family regulator